MKTTLFASVSIDGFIANQEGIPMFPEGAWEDWCALVNETGNVIAGRSSVEQLQVAGMAAALTPPHKIVLSSKDFDFSDDGWRHAGSAAEALAMLSSAGVEEAIVGGGRAVYHSFMRDNLVDEVVIDHQPIAFGQGVALFGDALDPIGLKLLESQNLNDDACRVRYQVVRV